MILKLIPNTLCGSQKEAAKHVSDKMVVLKEPLNRKRTQATTSQDAQLNFTKLFEVTVPKRCYNLLPDAPFYLAINHRRKPNDKVWYLDRPLGKNEIGKFLKDAFAAAKLDDTNKKKVSNHSVRKTIVGRLLEADVQPNFVAQLSGHKNLKSLDSYHSASLKRQREMSAILNREPGTSAQSDENQVSTSTTSQQNVLTVQQIQPQAIFAGAHIDKFEGCTFNINVFCGDRSKIARLNDN